MYRKGKRKVKVKVAVKGKGKGVNREPMEKSPPWLELPVGIWWNILHRLGAIEIMGTAEKVCTTWWRVCKDPSMWRVIDLWSRGDPDELPGDFDKICRLAVDRSQGELVDINLEYFVTDELLSYVVDRSRKLRRLSIACCYGMLCEHLVEVVQKLPLLEELSLTHTDITTEGIEALGHSCPQLKTFKLNNSCYMGSGAKFDSGDRRNDEALDIAKNLPGLHHLQLIANSITNEGLHAILDGCPNLVSLDLRLCTNVRLDEVLISRLSRIKDVKRPDDSMKGFTFGFESWGSDVDECSRSSEDDMYDDGYWYYGDGMYDDDYMYDGEYMFADDYFGF